MAATIVNSELVQDFTLSAPITPLGAAVSATATLYIPIPIEGYVYDAYSASNLLILIDRVAYNLLLASAADSTNKWTLTVTGSDAVGTVAAAILGATDIAATATTGFADSIETGFTIYDLPLLTTVDAPCLKLVVTKAASAPNITYGNVLVHGRIVEVA